jgi:tetratricopeptide (TPR) repeat protein
VALVSAAAHADTPPNAWDAARDPGARQRWTLHVRVERLLAPVRSEDDGGPVPRVDRELRHEAARAMLEEADAAHSPDVRLRFDLGRVYYELADDQGGRADLYRKAIDVLAPAVDAAPDEPAATEALSVLVYAYAKTNHPREELATWRRYIPRLVDDRGRVVAMMNMGEAEMRLGHVDDATATFREVLRLCGELPNTSSAGSTYALTLFDLAVALDRSGDARSALDTAARASHMNVIDSTGTPTDGASLLAQDPNVFFVPEWEREWYLALVAGAAAREAKDARRAAALWTAAEDHWDRYIERASAAGGNDASARPQGADAHADASARPQGADAHADASARPQGADAHSDIWLSIAKVRRERTHTERVAAVARAAKLGELPGRRLRPWNDGR